MTPSGRPAHGSGSGRSRSAPSKSTSTANRNDTTCLFDVASGRRLHVLGKPMSHELKFDPTGKKLAIVYVDATIAIWNVETGKFIVSNRAQAEELYTVDWSPDGSLLVTAGQKGSVTLWNAQNLLIVNELQSPEWVISARFNPEGTKLVFGGGTQHTAVGRCVETWGVP